MSKKEKLMRDFPPVTREAWGKKITLDLKGVPYEKLFWKSIEGFNVKPYYREDDLKKIPWLNVMPGEFPFVRSVKKHKNDWEIREDIHVENLKEANRKALKALNRGATSLGFWISEDIKLNEKDFSTLLKDIYFDCINVNFITSNQASEIYKLLLQEVKKLKIDPKRIIGSINFDPIGDLSLDGVLSSFEKRLEELAGLVRQANYELPELKLININGQHFHNAGASIVQELAFSLSILSEYTEKLTNAGLDADTVARSVQANFATGPVYFTEISKYRAARILFSHLFKAWEVTEKNMARLFIHTSTSEWNQTIYDPYVNMLRGTTEGMSAALGGVNSISIVPFDRPFRDSTDFSERIARNTQIVLKEEAHLDKVIDPAAGSYYIESLTESLIENAWELFLEIEEHGGYLESLKSGIIAEKINESAQTRDRNIAISREVLVGTNKYPNQTEYSPEDLDENIAFPPENKNQDFPVIKKYRGAEAFEKLRLATEKSIATPVVFLLTYGSINWRKARADFAYSFFSCAGYKLIDNNGFESIDEGIEAACKQKANIIVLCSSDDEYGDINSDHIKAIKKTAIPVIAGDPKEFKESLTKYGVEKFVHMKTNVIAELNSFHKIMGIT